MSITIGRNSGNGGTFTPHPAGQMAAICVDVHDLGLVRTQFQNQAKMQRKGEIYFFCGLYLPQEPQERPEQPEPRKIPMLVKQRFTLTLSEKGNLLPFLESWRGQQFHEEELDAFDLETVVGAPAFIQIVHNTKGDRTYANVGTIMSLPKNFPRVGWPEGFVRIKDRPENQDQERPVVPGMNQPNPGRPVPLQAPAPAPVPAPAPMQPVARPQLHPEQVGLQPAGPADYDDDDLPF